MNEVMNPTMNEAMNPTARVNVSVISGDEYLVLKQKNGYSLTQAERDYLRMKGVLTIIEMSSRPGLNF